MHKGRFLLAFMVMMPSALQTAFAYSDDAVTTRLEMAQNGYIDYSQQGGTGEDAGGDTASLFAKYTMMEEDNRRMRGDVEQLQHQMDQLNTRLQQLEARQAGIAAPGSVPTTAPAAPSPQTTYTPTPQQSTIAGEAAAINAGVPAPAAPTPIVAPVQQPGSMSTEATPPQAASKPVAPTAPAAVPTSSAVPALDNNPAAKPLYDAAFKELKNLKYTAARNAFKHFITQYPNHTLTPDAMFWVAETLYNQQKKEEASVQFLDLYSKFPASPRAPESLLRLGSTLIDLQKKQQACTVLAKIPTEYPSAGSNILERAQIEQTKAGC